MNTVSKLLLILGLNILIANLALSKPPLPSVVIAPSLGQEKGLLGELGIKGFAGTLRLQKLFPTYPIVGVGLDAKYSLLKIDDGGSNINAKRTSLSLVFPTFIPLDLFGINLDKLPKGGGPPIYIAYSFYNKLDINNFSEDLDGQGWKAGLMLPAPGGAIQFEYSDIEFDDFDDLQLASLFQSSNLDSKTWTVSYHLPIPITSN